MKLNSPYDLIWDTYQRGDVAIVNGSCLEVLSVTPDSSAQCCVTSPPYFGLRDYGHPDQLGLEPTPEDYIDNMVAVFREVRRVLKDDGTLWLNLGDSYYSGNGQPKGRDDRSPSRNFSRELYRWADRPGMGLPKKSLVGIPWLVAHALQKDGWTLRAEIIWHRPTGFIESGVTDRPYRKHETVFLLSKSRRYYFDPEARALGTVWSIEPERGIRGHNAAFPAELPRRCIAAGSRPGDLVLDPFSGSGTTGEVALLQGRGYLGCEINPDYVDLSRERLLNAFAKIQPETLATAEEFA